MRQRSFAAHIRWTQPEMAILRAHYPFSPWPDLLNLLPGRARSVINGKATGLGLKRPALIRRTPEEVRQTKREHMAARRAADPEAARILEQDRADTDALVHSVIDPETIARTPRRIIAQIAADHGVTPEAITGPSQKRAIVLACWQAVVAVAAEHPHLSLPAPGRIFGGRDHTTILHALRKIRDPDYRRHTGDRHV